MKIAVIGATGMIGQKVVPEALDRGHDVTAISRNPDEEYEPGPNLELTAANVLYRDQLIDALEGHDAVVSTFAGPYISQEGVNAYGIYMEGARNIKLATKRVGVDPLVFVGGAGSLHVEEGHQLMEEPGFPVSYLRDAPERHIDYLLERAGGEISSKEEFFELNEVAWNYPESPDHYIIACRTAKDLYKHDDTFDWSFISPPWYLRPGERTGDYETQTDDLPVDEDGDPLGISVADLGVAIIDEVEEQNHNHDHWTAYAYDGY